MSDNADFVSPYHCALGLDSSLPLADFTMLLPSTKSLMPIHSLDLRTDVIKIQHPPESGTVVTIDYSVVCRKRKMFAENGIKSQWGLGTQFPRNLQLLHPSFLYTASAVKCTLLTKALLNIFKVTSDVTLLLPKHVNYYIYDRFSPPVRKRGWRRYCD